MKGATIFLILGTILIALWFLGIPPERPGFRPDIGLLEGVAESLAYRGFGVAFLLAGTILAITGLLSATPSMVERPRRAKTEVARAPIKIPLVSFIFAALFIVILGPAIISIMINLRT